MFRRALPVLATGDYSWAKEKLNPGIGRCHNLLVDRAQGSFLYTESGEKYLDFAAGIGTTNLGHCHPRLVKVAQKQLEKLWHQPHPFGIHTTMRDMIQELETVVPEYLSNFMFVTTGAEAVETALKVSRLATGRQNTAVLQGSFHGRSVATGAMTTSKAVYTKGMRPLMPGIVPVPVPYASQLHVKNDTSIEAMTEQALGIVRDVLNQQTHPSEVSMLVAEPVLGEGGYYPLPTAYLKGLQKICNENGILFAIDEVQSGFGRTGSLFNFTQHAGLEPDILIFAKGFANGLPVSGIAMRKEISDKATPGSMGGTYAGNAVACASATEVIKVMKEEGILENVVARGEQLITGLQAIVTKHELPVMEVRGRGLMVALQLHPSCPAGTSGKLVEACTARNLVLMNTSIYETLRLIPPLTVSAEEIDMALNAIEGALVEVVGPLKGQAPATTQFEPCCDTPCQTAGGFCRHFAQ